MSGRRRPPAAHFVAEAVRRRMPGHWSAMSRLSRTSALVLLFAGLALGQIAARLSDHRAISLLGLLCLAGMLLVFVVQGWREPQGRGGRG